MSELSAIVLSMEKALNILMIGGTQFVGRHLVEIAVRQGHTVTLFNRGTNPSVYPDLKHIKGDRNKLSDLEKLANNNWDAVIDTCAYFPRQVKELLSKISNQTKHYTMISSISVYSEQTKAFICEDEALAKLEDETVEEVNGETYGGLKVLCESAANEFIEHVLIPRPGLIVGPHDHTDRFTYWPERISQGSEVLAPDKATVPAQFIDVRDLAEWTIQAIEQSITGAFNIVNDAGSVTFGQLLETCQQATGSDSKLTWVDEAFLLENEVSPWSDLPIWVPEELHGFMMVSNERARIKGLTPRPVKETIEATLEWLKTLPEDREPKAGLTAEKEQTVLRAWYERTNAASG